MLVVLLSTAIPIFGQCPYNKVVGSNVGISNLTQALNAGVLTTNSTREVIGDFCVNGEFTVNFNKNFRNTNIEILSNSKLSLQAVAHYLCSLLELSFSNPSECTESRMAKVGDNVVISPNPASNSINLSGVDINQVLIFDIVGNKMMNWTKVSSTVIEISNLPNGIYIIKTHDGKVSKKFIKM